ncbi:MAG TPA: ABC transporter substrate-binding protein, partial [Tepidisphaeraceae bacterium]|nr:ABC transporter substrate-binding protein [Tepidisphaeraceae bacterium]
MGQRPAAPRSPATSLAARLAPMLAAALIALALVALLALALLGCDRREPPPAATTPSSTTQASTTQANTTQANTTQASTTQSNTAAAATTTKTPTARAATTVASLSPAATEIIVHALGARDRLVAVSNFDPQRPETAGLPRVGDYQTVDWERLAALRPATMVTQFAVDRLPRGLRDRAAELNITLINVPITRLADIHGALATLGEAVGDPTRGRAEQQRLQARLDAIAARSRGGGGGGGGDGGGGGGGGTAGRKVRTLLVVDDA